jgi:hypothetical protein
MKVLSHCSQPESCIYAVHTDGQGHKRKLAEIVKKAPEYAEKGFQVALDRRKARPR